MSEYIARFESYLKSSHIPHVIINDQIFWSYQKMIVPLGPVQKTYSLSADDIKVLFLKIPGILIRWNKPTDNNNSPWYAVLSDQFIPLEAMSSKLRYQFKKSLENCQVRRIDINNCKDEIYQVYKKAHENYEKKITSKQPANVFINKLKIVCDYPDIIHYWGVFHQNILIGYAEILVYGADEANISVVKILPGFKDLLPSYALYFSLCEYYLEKEKVACISDGYKSLLHESNIQEFLIKKLFFKKKPLYMYRVYKKPVKYLLKALFLLSMVVPSEKFIALKKMETIYRSQNQ